MENANNKKADTDLLAKAKSDLIADMKERGFAAVIWDLSTAGFQYIPEILLSAPGKPVVMRVTGLYRYNGVLYLIEEHDAGVSVNEFYDRDSEVKPSVVTLTDDSAREALGDPENKPGYTTVGTLEEWLNIADAYFQALSEHNPPM